MNREDVTRRDFPEAPSGYDRPSVDAHLEAVAATIAALEAQIRAAEVERDALRRNAPSGSPEPARLPTPIAAVPDLDPADEVVPAGSLVAVSDDEPADPAESIVPAGSGNTDSTDGAGEAAPGPDESSARLVAMKMALDGARRDEILKRLSDEYELSDADGLVDDVIKRVG